MRCDANAHKVISAGLRANERTSNETEMKLVDSAYIADAERTCVLMHWLLHCIYSSITTHRIVAFAARCCHHHACRSDFYMFDDISTHVRFQQQDERGGCAGSTYVWDAYAIERTRVHAWIEALPACSTSIYEHS